jgi:hypothetical protein
VGNLIGVRGQRKEDGRQGTDNVRQGTELGRETRSRAVTGIGEGDREMSDRGKRGKTLIMLVMLRNDFRACSVNK